MQRCSLLERRRWLTTIAQSRVLHLEGSEHVGRKLSLHVARRGATELLRVLDPVPIALALVGARHGHHRQRQHHRDRHDRERPRRARCGHSGRGAASSEQRGDGDRAEAAAQWTRVTLVDAITTIVVHS